MKKFMLLVFVASLVTSCAPEKGDKGDKGDAGVSAPVVSLPVDDVQSDIDALVRDESAYRQGLGQTALSQGLACTLYSITGGDRIQASISGHNTLTGITTVGTFRLNVPFNQPNSNISAGMNVLPAPFRTNYTNMYLLRCQGQIVVRDSDYHLFELSSDDASVLYVDGSKVIDNDNAHGITVLTGQKYLRRGVHTIRLDYAQTGAGDQALILKQNGTVIDPKFFYY